MTHPDDMARLRANPDYDADEMRTVHAAPAAPPDRYPEARALALQVADLWEARPEAPPEPVHDRPGLAELQALQTLRPSSGAAFQALGTLRALLDWHQQTVAVLERHADDPDAESTLRDARYSGIGLGAACRALELYLAECYPGDGG